MSGALSREFVLYVPDHDLFSLASLEVRVQLSGESRKLLNNRITDLDLTSPPAISVLLGNLRHLFSELVELGNLLRRLLVRSGLLHPLAHSVPRHTKDLIAARVPKST